MSDDPETKREAHRKAILAASATVNAIEQDLFQRHRTAMQERNDLMADAHGDPREGGLTYQEIADEAGLSKGRVIQLLQGVSEYSRRIPSRRGR